MNGSDAVGKIIPLLDNSLQLRLDMLSPPHQSAVRLFNGFLEGYPRLVVDLFGRTLVVYNFSKPPEQLAGIIPALCNFYLSRLEWLGAVLVKTRHAREPSARAGSIVYGTDLDERILEFGVWYALDLQMNQDAGLYLDTRLLRKWLVDHTRGGTVLNLFAYTGGLGVAARAGGARRVVQVDRNHKFLEMARASYALNSFEMDPADLVEMDFWAYTARMRREKALFDCVILDPPFFSSTSQGSLQLERHTRRLVNKVRPLVSHQGYLIVINNALYLSGVDFNKELEALGSGGHLALEAIIPVPADITGDESTQEGEPPVDPAPFNHSTKIAVLRARRKDGLTSQDNPPPVLRG